MRWASRIDEQKVPRSVEFNAQAKARLLSAIEKRATRAERHQAVADLADEGNEAAELNDPQEVL